jgi:hypothetical protein
MLCSVADIAIITFLAVHGPLMAPLPRVFRS